VSELPGKGQLLNTLSKGPLSRCIVVWPFAEKYKVSFSGSSDTNHGSLLRLKLITNNFIILYNFRHLDFFEMMRHEDEKDLAKLLGAVSTFTL
jgi:hypothetical protein